MYFIHVFSISVRVFDSHSVKCYRVYEMQFFIVLFGGSLWMRALLFVCVSVTYIYIFTDCRLLSMWPGTLWAIEIQHSKPSHKSIKLNLLRWNWPLPLLKLITTHIYIIFIPINTINVFSYYFCFCQLS